MDRVKLEARVRDTSSKSNLKKLRKSGRAAASVYGHGTESVAISVDMGELAAAVRTEAGLHALMELEIKDGRKKDSGVVVIKRVQKDPLTQKVLHIDFQRVKMTEKLTTEVAIEFLGTAAGVQQAGIVEHVIDHVQVRCFPDRIPSHMDLDVSALDIGQALHIKDLPLPEGVEILASPDEVVVAVRPPYVHVEEEVEKPEAEEGAAEAAAEETPAEEG